LPTVSESKVRPLNLSRCASSAIGCAPALGSSALGLQLTSSNTSSKTKTMRIIITGFPLSNPARQTSEAAFFLFGYSLGLLQIRRVKTLGHAG
jgi:hypothetical protein